MARATCAHERAARRGRRRLAPRASMAIQGGRAMRATACAAAAVTLYLRVGCRLCLLSLARGRRLRLRLCRRSPLGLLCFPTLLFVCLGAAATAHPTPRVRQQRRSMNMIDMTGRSAAAGTEEIAATQPAGQPSGDHAGGRGRLQPHQRTWSACCLLATACRSAAVSCPRLRASRRPASRPASAASSSSAPRRPRRWQCGRTVDADQAHRSPTPARFGDA